MPPEPNSTSQLEGRYANSLAVGRNEGEIVMEFGQSYGEENEPVNHTRIVAGPVYAKRFLHTLQLALDQYEQEYGVICDDPRGRQSR